MTPIQFTGDITIIPSTIKCTPDGEHCRVGPLQWPLKRGEWLVIHQRQGIQVVSNAAYRQAEREVAETLYRWAA